MVLQCIDKLDKLYFLSVFTKHGLDNCCISAYVLTIEKKKRMLILSRLRK